METQNPNTNTIIITDTSPTATNSPEFEFKNPSSSQPPTLLSADQLFSDGFLLPLHLLTTTHHPPDIPPEPTNPPSLTQQDPQSDLKTTPVTASKRWKDIFKKNPEKKDKEKTKKKNSGAVSGTGAGTTGTAELNINLWPFSRSRSAGNNRPRTVVGNRKVSSAPCSRSNSTGDKHRKWPTSPGRVGVHLGRSSPVWQAKRVVQSRSVHDTRDRNAAEKGLRQGKSSAAGAGASAGGNGKVLSINVPTCIGYRQRMGCQSDVRKEDCDGCVAGGNGGVTAVGGGGDGGATGLFSLRSLFTKKVF